MLVVDMGLGKTIVISTVLADLADDIDFGPVLIAAPKRVAATVWPVEVRSWRHTKFLTCTHITGDAATRRRLMRRETCLHVIGFDLLAWLVREWGKDWPYRIVIFDESSRLRDHRSVTFRAMKAVRPRLKRLHLLTATPAAQRLEALFPQVWLTDLGERLGSYVTHFRREYFDESRFRRGLTPKPGARERIFERIADKALVMQRKDYLDMPEALVQQRVVRMSAAERAKYIELETEYVLQVAPDRLVEAQTAAALSQKLLQLASGAVYDADRVAHEIHSRKLDELAEIVEECAGQPLLVAYWFKSTLERLRRRFPQLVVLDKRGEAVKAWNERRVPLLALHPQAGAHGLNLQFGGHNLVIVDSQHSLELHQQLIKRLDRPGQTETVVVQMLTTEGTLDEVVAARLRRLEDAQEDMFRRLKALRAQAEGRLAA